MAKIVKASDLFNEGLKPSVSAGKLTHTDWQALLQYDRETGNILRYDPETGKMDERSRAILRDTDIIQRLIDNKMILPGGWLTTEAKAKCDRLKKELNNQQTNRSTKSENMRKLKKSAELSAVNEIAEVMDRKALSRYERQRNENLETVAPDMPALSLRDVFHVIFKRRVQIMLFFIAVVITVGLATFFAEPTYEATAQILVKLGRESVFVPTGSDARPIINYNREERINSEIEILKSRSLAEKVVLALGPTVIYEELKGQKPGIVDLVLKRILPREEKILTPDERAASNLNAATSNILNALEVAAVKDSNIIQVSFKHPDSRMVSIVVNKLADAYLEHHLEVHKTPQSHKFFKEQSELLKNKLELAERELEALKKQHSITSLEEERTLLLQQASGLRSEMNQTASQIVETEKRMRQIRQQLAATPKTIAQGEVINRNEQLISTLEGRLVELELEEKDLLAKYTDQSRLVQNVREEIRIVREKLAAQEKKRFGSKRSGVNPTYQQLQASFFHNEAELNALKAKADTQKSQLNDYQQKLDKLNQMEIKLSQLRQQVDVDRQNYRLYLTKFEESRISDAMDTEKIASVSIIEPARQPLIPVSPRKMLNLLLAVFLGTFGGLGLAFFMEYLDDKLEKVEDVEDCLGLPVLASIPELKTIKQSDAESKNRHKVNK